MKTFNEFVSERKNLNLNFKIRNGISFLLYVYLAYNLFNYIAPSLKGEYLLMLFMGCATLVLSLAIFTVKFRYASEVKMNNLELHLYMKEAISQARLKGDYQIVNQLLDSKYSVHMILVMSSYPLASFDFNQLQKWVKLPDAIKYFQANKMQEEDLLDGDKMRDYLKTVYPEFLQALANSR